MVNNGIIYQNVGKTLKPESVTNRKFSLWKNNSIQMKLNGSHISIMYGNIIDSNNLDKKM